MNGGTALAIQTHYEAEEIPLACRILRVADSYAALTDARPFRAAHSSCVGPR
jgi:HD-GYP domain-containing protein (c-di-GMP phosphodiesterase class II)